MEGLLKKGENGQLQGGLGFHVVLCCPLVETNGQLLRYFNGLVHAAK